MKILSFDVESNGLHGDAFAVAGVLVDEHRHILEQFVARSPILGKVDPWVKENVLGPMNDIEETHADAKMMRSAFWKWYVPLKAGADMVVAANPYPVEAQFLLACQNDDMSVRSFEHPFPYYDLSSMLYMLGIIAPAARREFVAKAWSGGETKAHNPLWDATATAMAALAAVQVSEKLMSKQDKEARA